MPIVRKLLLAIVFVCATLAPLAGWLGPSQAAAGHGYAQTRTYYLYARACTHCPWTYVGGTANYSQAVYYGRYLQSRGYQVYLY
ncbi:MAG: hypothetical protein AB7O62_01150 [Pirellulales bacterium]